MVWFQELELTGPSHVPLSCVPPISVEPLVAIPWNCRVDRPAFIVVSFVGTAESCCRQDVVYTPLPVGQFADASATWPLEWMSPPSDPSKNRSGLAGSTSSVCWSGWMPVVGEALSRVWSAQCA